MAPVTTTLPSFPAPTRRERAILDASRDVVALFLREARSDFSVKELAQHTGLAERTFYRHFPRKEDAVGPYLRAGLAQIVEAIRQAPPNKPLRQVLWTAHAALLDASVGEAASVFLAVMEGNERLRAFWLALGIEAERSLAEVLAPRLGVLPGSTRARLASAATVAAARLALECATDAGDRRPSQVYAACLDLLGPELFAPDAP